MIYEVKVAIKTEADNEVEAIDRVVEELSIVGISNFSCYEATEKKGGNKNE
jgi:hypothetical protein